MPSLVVSTRLPITTSLIASNTFEIIIITARNEEEYNALVYHVIHSPMEFGDCYNFLYVSDHPEEWEYDILDLYGMKIAIDCSNGAASVTAPELFMKLCDDCFFRAGI